MPPLLALHAIAAPRGDGLHPVLLAGLRRLAAERVQPAMPQPGREQDACATTPTVQRTVRAEAAKPPRAA